MQDEKYFAFKSVGINKWQIVIDISSKVLNEQINSWDISSEKVLKCCESVVKDTGKHEIEIIWSFEYDNSSL